MRAAILALFMISLLMSFASGDLYGEIDSVKIIPSHPTTEDSIYIEVYCWFPDSCWHIEGSTLDEMEPTIHITVKAVDSWHDGADCLLVRVDRCFVDSIGQLDEGTYAVQAVENLQSERDSIPDTEDMKFFVDSQSAADEDNSSTVPGAFTLEQNHPNPFNAGTIISYSVETACHVELAIYDLLGRKIRTIVNGNVCPGEHVVVWDGSDDSGSEGSSGVYFYRLISRDQTSSRKMVLLK